MKTFRRLDPAIALSSLAIALSAFLLFTLEPFIAKRILPWFGGSAAVWSTCLVFFQTALLAGYLYARLSARFFPPRMQAACHTALLAAALFLLPIGPSDAWQFSSGLDADPSWRILRLLTATIGLPFLVLSATSPLLQHWLAHRAQAAPYWLFAISNFASLAALLLYPAAIEPALNLARQSVFWSVLFVLFALVCAGVAWFGHNWFSHNWSGRGAAVPVAPSSSAATGSYSPRHPWYWFLLSACGSMLLLAITNHITENVAAVPLLWILPLSAYLFSFVLSFGFPVLYRRPFFLRVLAFALGLLGYAVFGIDSTEPIQISLPVFLACLFVCCWFCHAELNRLRPPAPSLTLFYLLIAAGGAAGAISIGLLAPRLFSGIYELPLTLTFLALLTLRIIWSTGDWPARLLWFGVAACLAFVSYANVQAYHRNSLSLRRSFYGSLRVVQSPHAGREQIRTLYHGTVQHGAEFLWPDRRARAVTYYGPDSGIGIVLRECFPSPRRIGVVGLGAGTLAAYGRSGDTLRFYEINRQVIDIAQSLFFFTRETPARVEMMEGDARLSLAREAGPAFDVLALDAFSGDAVPVHLLTREALALYLRRLRPDGVIAFHVSNNYLELGPVVELLAREADYSALDIKSHANPDEMLLPAEWVIVTRNTDVLSNTALKIRAQPFAHHPGLRPWTDSFNNLLEVLKTPSVR